MDTLVIHVPFYCQPIWFCSVSNSFGQNNNAGLAWPWTTLLDMFPKRKCIFSSKKNVVLHYFFLSRFSQIKQPHSSFPFSFYCTLTKNINVFVGPKRNMIINLWLPTCVCLFLRNETLKIFFIQSKFNCKISRCKIYEWPISSFSWLK